MIFKASFNVPIHSGQSGDSFQANDFRTIANFKADIDYYTTVRNSDCTLRGYTDDEDADLVLSNVARITCLSHDEVVAEVVVSEKLIIHYKVEEKEESVHFHFYLFEDHLRFGKIMFLRPEDIQ